jgi:DNA polymerase III alpha subunit (gram-positive type)
MKRPQPSEYHPFYNGYIQLVPDGNYLQLLKANSLEVNAFFSSIRKEKHDYKYQPGKWSIKQVLLHLIDTERVMSYRALTVSRGDVNTQLPNMDENLFAANAQVTGRTIEDLLNEFAVVRESTALLFGYMSEPASEQLGNVLGHAISPRALGYIIIGHADHHMNIIRQRYL